MKAFKIVLTNNDKEFIILKNGIELKNYNNIPRYVRFDIFKFLLKYGLKLIIERSYYNGKLLFSLCEKCNDKDGFVTYIKSYDLRLVISKAFDLIKAR